MPKSPEEIDVNSDHPLTRVPCCPSPSRRVAAVAPQGLRLDRPAVVPRRAGPPADLHVQAQPGVQPPHVQERSSVRLVAGPLRTAALGAHRAVQGRRQGLVYPGCVVFALPRAARIQTSPRCRRHQVLNPCFVLVHRGCVQRDGAEHPAPHHQQPGRHLRALRRPPLVQCPHGGCFHRPSGSHSRARLGKVSGEVSNGCWAEVLPIVSVQSCHFFLLLKILPPPLFSPSPHVPIFPYITDTAKGPQLILQWPLCMCEDSNEGVVTRDPSFASLSSVFCTVFFIDQFMIIW